MPARSSRVSSFQNALSRSEPASAFGIAAEPKRRDRPPARRPPPCLCVPQARPVQVRAGWILVLSHWCPLQLLQSLHFGGFLREDRSNFSDCSGVQSAVAEFEGAIAHCATALIVLGRVETSVTQPCPTKMARASSIEAFVRIAFGPN